MGGAIVVVSHQRSSSTRPDVVSLPVHVSAFPAHTKGEIWQQLLGGLLREALDHRDASERANRDGEQFRGWYRPSIPQIVWFTRAAGRRVRSCKYMPNGAFSKAAPNRAPLSRSARSARRLSLMSRAIVAALHNGPRSSPDRRNGEGNIDLPQFFVSRMWSSK